VNLVDVIIILLVAGAAVHGYLLGAAVQVATAVGLGAGLAAGAALAPVVSRAGGSPTARAVLALGTLVVVTIVLTGLGRTFGARLWERVHRGALGRVDALGGAAFGGVVTLLFCWLVASIAARLPAPTVASEVQHSAILRALDGELTAPPRLFARIGRLVDPLGFPDVFAQFEPGAAPSLPLPGDPVVQAAVAAGAASTVKIEGVGCGEIQEGSGFVAAPGLVITNAHVVAGVGQPVVLDRAGRHRAQAVLFDPRLDVAVLRTTGLVGRPLPLLGGNVGRGSDDAVLGYPGGGPFRAVPAVVLTELPALGRDIYGRSLTARTIYELRADVRPGNSGGPLLRPDGTVVGVVFARSSRNPNLGFALTSVDARSRLASAEAQGTAAVSTGPCAAG
jgi:S1-C subfamily serine protease